MIRYCFTSILICLLLVGCKATKGVSDHDVVKKLNTNKIIKAYNANTTHFNTLKASLKTNVRTAEQEENITVDIRIEKDQQLWASIKKFGISGAKIHITPEKVQFYNKQDKTFFKGDFSLISNWLGTDLSFNQLQAILIGEVLYPLHTKTHKSEILEDGYLLQPSLQKELFEQFITLNPSHFKVKSQEIAQPQKFRVLSIDYHKYQEVSKQILPLELHVIVLEKTSETKVSIEYRNVSLNPELRFPFKIPSSYKEIVFE